MWISDGIESHVVAVRVIKSDEHHYGVVVDYTDDTHTAYPVGTRLKALAEARALRSGKRRPALLQD
jgi:hypothetical protein